MNTAWTENMDFNQWLCYDEQMVKTVSRYAHFLMRHQPKKPITHGTRFVFRVVWTIPAECVFSL